MTDDELKAQIARDGRAWERFFGGGPVLWIMAGAIVVAVVLVLVLE